MIRFSTKHGFGINQGIILVDILFALTLASVFIAAVTESSIGAREIFEYAKRKNTLLDIFDNYHNGGATTSAVTISSRPFGNDRTEDIIRISSQLIFSSIQARPFSNINEVAGTPLCSVDLINNTVVGSYEYLKSAGLYGAADDSSSSVQSSLVTRPPTITPIALPVNPLLPLTDLQVRNGVAYISVDSSTASDADLLAVDINDKRNPTILSSINTGPGISSFALAGKFIYAAAASTAGQLHVIEINNLNKLTVKKRFKLPLPYATATPPYGSAIFYDRGMIYLGTEKWDGREFSVIDITNPADPQMIGSFEIGSKVNSVFVLNGIAYVADSDQEQLRVVDVSDPANPVLANSFSPSGWERQEGKVVSIFEGRLTFGRTSGGFNMTVDHEAFSWATTSLTSIMPPHSMDVPGGVYGAVQDRNGIFMATRDINKEFQITNQIISSTTVIGYSLPVAPQTITCDNGRLYILAHTAPVIYEISF
ncbi:hypothetical protein KGQ27_01795 [Patescibacteria group bacterium]|nr:hypothetical protein [Patescibacteria group bacterium]MDE1946350.1 hypothetical protein [Patescibacteria group bacterium]MDE2010802.1 hypothetical protein [Patescibacteria group bacterium]MDE2233265.1 hypothetical protein [Patescibacteria group bacterium]